MHCNLILYQFNIVLLFTGVEHCRAIHREILHGIHPRVPPIFPHSLRSGPAPITTETGQAGVTRHLFTFKFALLYSLFFARYISGVFPLNQVFG